MMFPIPLAALLAAAAGQAPPSSADRSAAGPSVICGEAFAIRLAEGESGAVHDPGMDFITYEFHVAGGIVVVYEGNFPQPHDDEVTTGLQWPSVVAIHDNRSDAARRGSRFRDRIVVGPARAELCPTPARESE